jgi:hypothetical protein
MSDSIKIGQVIPYSLTAKYSRDLNILFPDSTYGFFPFELRGKRFFSTRTVQGVSYDSVVYLFTTYEIAPIQKLKLPIFIVEGLDSLAVYTRVDSVALHELVKHVPDSVSAQHLPLKTDADYRNVRLHLNYPILLLILGGLLLIGLTVWLIFGKRIRTYFALRRLTRDHTSFVHAFNQCVAQLQSDLSSFSAETALAVWKKYMEQLASQPYTKSTSTEISRIVSDPNVGSALKSIDKIIYGGAKPANERSFQFLLDYSVDQFKRRKEAIKHE